MFRTIFQASLRTSVDLLNNASNFRRSVCSSTSLFGQMVQFKLSDIGEGIAEVQIKEWHIKEGDAVKQFDNLCEVQSDKASVTITSRYDGVVKKLHYKVDEIAKVGRPLVDIELESSQGSEDESSSSSSDEEADVSKDASEKSGQPCEHAASASGVKKALATPAVRRIASENKVVLTAIKGTGKEGRVLKEDIMRHISDLQAQVSSKSTAAPAQAAMPKTFVAGVDRTERIRGFTRAMVKTMAEANKIPHFGYCDEVYVNRLVDLRDQLKQIAAEKGVKMSYMPLFIKAASLALLEFPILNASLDEACENITYKASHNICVAMDTPEGLAVPSIKHCEQKSLWEIAVDLNRLQETGKRGQFTADDLRGGTFTLSNIGSIGGTYAKPVLMPNQVIIGALGKIQVLPRFKPNSTTEIFAAHIVRVSWSADHRVIDGATVARFSNVWKQYLEHPALMIAQMK